MFKKKRINLYLFFCRWKKKIYIYLYFDIAVVIYRGSEWPCGQWQDLSMNVNSKSYWSSINCPVWRRLFHANPSPTATLFNTILLFFFIYLFFIFFYVRVTDHSTTRNQVFRVLYSSSRTCSSFILDVVHFGEFYFTILYIIIFCERVFFLNTSFCWTIE